jgi:hypothetical protein
MGWMQLAGTAVSALSQMKAGDDAQQAALSDAMLRSANIRKLAVRTQGEARAATAASGVDVNSPTAKIINDQIHSDSEQDVMNTMLGAKRAGQTAVQASRTNAIGTALNGFSTPYGQSALDSFGQSFSRWKTAPAASSGVGAGP